MAHKMKSTKCKRVFAMLCLNEENRKKYTFCHKFNKNLYEKM